MLTARLASIHSRSPRVIVTVDDDGLACVANVLPRLPGSEAVTAKEIEEAVRSRGVLHGIDQHAIRRAAGEGPGTYVVAMADLPTEGIDGSVEFAVALSPPFTPEETDDGGVDLRGVTAVPEVAAGDVIARLVPPRRGRPGRSVFGTPLSSNEPRPARLVAGTNTTFDAAGRLVATIDGLVERRGDVVSVRSALVVRGDVGFDTGSVDFSGDVVVRGSVLPGFSVEAGGQVVIAGDVEQASVLGSESVRVLGSVAGRQALVVSGGDVFAGIVYEGRIESRRSIFVGRECVDSTLLASESVVLHGQRTRIAGGTVIAGIEVYASEVGSFGAMPVEVGVGSDPLSGNTPPPPAPGPRVTARFVIREGVRLTIGGAHVTLKNAVFRMAAIERDGQVAFVPPTGPPIRPEFQPSRQP